jgi:glycosyltransferase involved in cell wall biosynthesis
VVQAGEACVKIALYHGYELRGSGSNEYTRYLARGLAALGHDVVVICGEPDPESFDFIGTATAYDTAGTPRRLFKRATDLPGRVSLHQLPRAAVLPVFIADQPRVGVVKTFPDLSAAELDDYDSAMTAVVTRAIADEAPEVVHANHLVYQPVVAARVCGRAGIPFYIVPHGSSIEYTIRRDERYARLARASLEAAAGVIWIAREVRDRVFALYPDLVERLAARSRLIGIGTDTSLFAPLAPAARPAALAELARLHRRGGKTPAQRRALCDAIDVGDLDATQRFAHAYDHRLEDDDFPARLARIPADGEILLFVGALTYGKGVHTLLAAMPAILAARPRAHLVIVGSGTYREALEAIAHTLTAGDERTLMALVARGRALEPGGAMEPLADLFAYAADPARRNLLLGAGAALADHIHFLGRLDHARLRHLFPCCRLAVFPSIVKEASPLVFAEALANGVLPLGAYHSGLRDGLDDLAAVIPGATWRLMRLAVEPEARVASVIESVCGLLAAPPPASLMAELRELAVDRYDWRAVAGQIAAAAADFAFHRPPG